MTVEFAPLGLILLFPALGVVFNFFFGRRAGTTAVKVMGPAVVFAAFAVATLALAKLLTLPAGSALGCRLWPWIEAGKFHVNVALRVDALSAVMVMVVSGVGAFIHLYSVGYMAHDEDIARYFGYMNLFALAMLILVLADNLLLMFVGWEGVGLCSYLLIAFWYSNPEYAYNGRKAFVVNRIGDAGFVLGILAIVATLGARGVWTLEFTEMQKHAGLFATGGAATVIGLLLLLGATGKSAQIPLYVWLPDAMVGPTPVSALIHAATMVTAGVYMVARLNFIYTLGPIAMDAVATVGALTALYAATIALVQPDIKKVLAYSTISQLGYMFLGVGVGGFAFGIFHLMTHAFFKGLLFLCAGSVMHALEGEQDMNRMGGLWRKLPITYATMLIATLAISAVPGLAGFFSKDLILEAAYASGRRGLWALGVITAAITSFYMFRLIFLTFHGPSRAAHHKFEHAHESPPVMTVPLVVLAVLSVVGGWVGLPEGMAWGDAFARFLAPVLGEFKATGDYSAFALSAVSTALAVAGIAMAWVAYIGFPGLPQNIARRFNATYEVLMKKYYVDELYNLIVTRPLFWLSTIVFNRGVDQLVIDGIVDGTGLTAQTGGQIARRVETGNVQHYLFVYLLGVVGVAAYYVYLVTH